MKGFFIDLIRDRGVWGLYLVNFVFQKILRITSGKVSLLHFTNVISAEQGFELVGEGRFAERCLRINGGIVIQAGNGVRLDRSVLLGPGVKIFSGNHDPDDFAKPSLPSAPIEIGADCWIGANAVILPGVRLLSRTIVGAGSVVTRSVDERNVIIAGNPAKIVRQRTKKD
ncbi:MAG: Maltose O-acetyltransferase [Betaproteobacteria bacterium ADurb.Bin341]|nr:MAG: Maltose O-acetyltransferase [Betaproteobacteria bacterium ADurb.Bin341]